MGRYQHKKSYQQKLFEYSLDDCIITLRMQKKRPKSVVEAIKVSFDPEFLFEMSDRNPLSESRTEPLDTMTINWMLQNPESDTDQGEDP